MHFFRKKKPVAKVDSTMVFSIHANDKSTSQALYEASQEWEDDKTGALMKHAHAPVFELYNSDDASSKDFKMYFSPYAFENFLLYYKSLIDENDVIPHTDGSVYTSAHINVGLYFNDFLPSGKDDNRNKTKDKKGNIRRILNSHGLVNLYKADKRHDAIASSDFEGNLLEIYRLIFFYNYTIDDLANNLDPVKELKKCKKLAKFTERSYSGQHQLDEQQIARMPSQRKFQQQDESSVYIPALVSPDLQKQREAEEQERNASYFNKFKGVHKGGSSVDSNATAQSLKAESDSIAKEQRASGSKSSQSVATSANSGQDSDNVPNSVATANGRRYSSADSTTSDSTSKLKSEASYYKSLATANAQNSQAVKDSEVANVNQSGDVANSASSADLVDVHEFAKSQFPMTNKSSVVRGAIQLLMDKDPNMFKPDFKFATFNVDKNMPAPQSIKEAIKTGNLNNQQYVIRMDNQNKRIANAVIKSRAKVLDMGYTRMLTDMLYGAYTKISQKTGILLKQTLNNDELTANAQAYYNKHYEEAVNKIEKGRKTELDTVNKALYDAYMSKKRLKDNKINARYDKEKRQSATKIDDMTKDLYYKARAERNKELRQQINDLTRGDLKKIRLQVKNHNIEWAHKMSQASKLLFNFLNDRLQAHHDKAVNTASKLITKQAEIMTAKSNMRQARAEMMRNRGNEQLRARWAKEQSRQQAYINKLNSQVDQYTGKLAKLQASNQETKSKMNQLIINNKTLQTQLNSANNTLVSNQKEIAQGRANLTKLNEAKAQNSEQQKNFAVERAQYNSRTASATATAKSKATSSANAKIQSNEMQVIQNNNSYQAKIFGLNQSLKSATKANNDNKSSLQSQLQNAQASLANYRSTVSTANSLNSQSMAQHDASIKASISGKNASYQNDLSLYARALGSASKAKQGMSQLQNQLSVAKQSLNDYRQSVSASNSARASLSASQSASIQASVSAKNNSYQSNMSNFATALSNASQANQNTQQLSSQLSNAKKSLVSYRQSVSMSNFIKKTNKASYDKSMKSSVASRNANYQNSLSSYAQALSNASQANVDSTHLQGELSDAQQSLSDYRSSVASSNSIKSASIASHDISVNNSIASRNAIYQNSMSVYSDALTKASKADGNTTKLRSQLAQAQSSFNDYRTSVSASNSVKASSIASHNMSVNNSVANRNASYQNKLNQYAEAVNNASQTNTDTASATSQLNMYKQSLAEYKKQVSASDEARSQEVADSQASASQRDSSYKARIDNLMTNLQNASQANNDTASAQAKLYQYKSSFSSYQTSVSTANSLRDVSLATSNSYRNKSYKATIERMQSNRAEASKANSLASKTHESNASFSASASEQASHYQSTIASYKSSFADYKSSISASSSNERKSVSASNSATSSMMSSATFSTPTDGTNVTTGAYDPKADEIEQKKLLEKHRARKQAVKTKRQRVAHMHKKRRKKKRIWEL